MLKRDIYDRENINQDNQYILIKREKCYLDAYIYLIYEKVFSGYYGEDWYQQQQDFYNSAKLNNELLSKIGEKYQFCKGLALNNTIQMKDIELGIINQIIGDYDLIEKENLFVSISKILKENLLFKYK